MSTFGEPEGVYGEAESADDVEVMANIAAAGQNASTTLEPAKDNPLGEFLKPIVPGQGDEQRLAEYVKHISGGSIKPGTVDHRVGTILEAIVDGRALVDVADALRRSFVNSIHSDDTHPTVKLALAPADTAEVQCTLYEDGVIKFGTGRPHRWGREFGIGESAGWKSTRVTRDRWVGRARVPQIPPTMRAQHDMKQRLVLWEPQWFDERYYAGKNVDPALLEPLSGTICIVHAVWDLTPIELAALGAGNEDLL